MGGNRLKLFSDGRLLRRQIVSEKSLEAVVIVTQHLKENSRNRDLFRATRHDVRAKQLASEMHGGGKHVERLLEEFSIREIASGLQYFLLCLKKPLIPPHIQALALDDNPGVAPEVIAHDILGLLREELTERHANLIMAVLDLLHHVLKYAPADELAGCSIPISMLPIFFRLETEHIGQWRRVAMIFVEMIRFAPSYFDIDVNDYDNFGILENFTHYNRGVNHALLQQRLLEMNVVLRRYIMRTGNRGDTCCYEVLRPRRSSPRRRLLRNYSTSANHIQL